MYISNESKNVAIISSKSSEMNVLLPKGNGDYVSESISITSMLFSNVSVCFQTEYAVPEQFKTTIKANGLSTVANDSLG